MADAEKTLRDTLDLILDDRGYKPREITVKAKETGGANYTSTLFVVNVSSPDQENLKLFVKVASVGESIRGIMHADYLYRTERLFYTQLTKIYEEIQEERNIPAEHRFIFPKFYGCNGNYCKETVVMEDLAAVGFEPVDRLKSIDWDHAKAAVENLAKFHALSFAFEKYRPEEFEILTSAMKFEMSGMDDGHEETVKVMGEKMIESAAGLVKKEYKERVRDFALTHKLWETYNHPIGKPVIAHGDYRTSNLLFRIQDDNLQAIAVDYQTVHAGCPAGDLVYFIFMGSDEEFRRQHYEKLLDHYFVCLEQALERLAVELSVYTREKFDSDMKELLPYAVLLGVMVLPVVTVQADAAPRVDGDADINDFVMKPNELFAQRFNGIVNDCIRWGAI
ncbi:uncharacterized protein LOC123875925 isoform X1 [Maniola jurtina]|uniref:uncharacterized protein LOC123875925 isoform X1 n=1 Tax=Maniola jurtina TaxID=191418 RepID=UPI001E68CB7D|nr:uncharacterized protein LOC123875925 isoform X1 [Maniola jurtina]